MYVRIKISKASKHPTIQIVKGVREGSRVRQRVVGSLGVIKDEKDLKKIINLAEKLQQQVEKLKKVFTSEEID